MNESDTTLWNLRIVIRSKTIKFSLRSWSQNHTPRGTTNTAVHRGGGNKLTTGAMRRAKLQSNCHHQQTNTQLFTCQMPFLSTNQQCQSTEGKDKQLQQQIGNE